MPWPIETILAGSFWKVTFWPQLLMVSGYCVAAKLEAANPVSPSANVIVVKKWRMKDLDRRGKLGGVSTIALRKTAAGCEDPNQGR
jgi:hypothetical protein